MEHVLVASTGVIGVALELEKVSRGVAAAAAVLGRDRHHDAARAIMTTDPWPKEAAVRIQTPAGSFSVGGMAKGSGMIEPMLATMLAFLTTDARVAPLLLRRSLAAAVRDTFNAITVDGECSTNDSVVALAGGASGVDIDEALAPALEAGLRAVSRELALSIVRGGEGATKVMAIRVVGARERAHAERAARVVANSPLVKTAVHGGDPNWGRLIAAGRHDRRNGALQQRRAARRGGAHRGRVPEEGRDRYRDRSGDRGHTPGNGLDVRSQRRVREDQRGLQDLRRPWGARWRTEHETAGDGGLFFRG